MTLFFYVMQDVKCIWYEITTLLFTVKVGINKWLKKDKLPQYFFQPKNPFL